MIIKINLELKFGVDENNNSFSDQLLTADKRRGQLMTVEFNLESFKVTTS